MKGAMLAFCAIYATIIEKNRFSYFSNLENWFFDFLVTKVAEKGGRIMLKRFLLLLLTLVCLSVDPLTVGAVSLDEDTIPTDISDSEKERSQEKVLEELGASDGIVWLLSVSEGREGSDEMVTLADMGRMHFMSAELESGHFYNVDLLFMAEIDPNDAEKFTDVALQLRFPNVLLKDNVNAIGSAIHGDKITAKSESFGIASEEDLALYYVENTAKIISLDESIQLTSDGAEALFASDTGVPLDETLALTMIEDVNGYKLATFDVRFLIYAAPLDPEEGIYRGDSELTYWAGRKPMYDPEDSVAPSGRMPRVATMDQDGIIHLPVFTDDVVTGSSSNLGLDVHPDTDILIVLVVIVIGVIFVAVYLATKVRQQAHEDGITGFWNIFLYFMHCGFEDNEEDESGEEK